MKNIIFVSHANPEDNQFSLWLALQLANEGYPIWCDLTKLLGGEDFWKDIETAIRDRTCKFLYVLSKASNTKDGPLQELQVAKTVARNDNLKDFIIPLRIDEIPFSEINIQLSRINAISFTKSWAQGLSILLEKLEKDKVAKKPNFNPSAVASWWRSNFKSDKGVYIRQEKYYSNWYPIKSMPGVIYFHALPNVLKASQELIREFSYPAFIHSEYIITFAPSEDFLTQYGATFSLKDSIAIGTKNFLHGSDGPCQIKRPDARNIVSRLLHTGWDNMVQYRGISTYQLAGGINCLYFVDGFESNNKANFVGLKNKKTYRKLVGIKFKTGEDGAKSVLRFWHFGIQSKPLLYPINAFIIKPHVLFSDDGKNIWESKSRLHAARRSQCKNWWNPEWRDRILAAMSWLADDTGNINIKLGENVIINVANWPLKFVSPVAFNDPDKEQPILETYDDDDNELLEEND